MRLKSCPEASLVKDSGGLTARTAGRGSSIPTELSWKLPECRCRRWGQRWPWGKHVDVSIRREKEGTKCLQKILPRIKQQEGDKKNKLWEAAEESMKEEAGLEPLLAFPLLLKALSLQFLHSCGSSLFCYRGLQWNSDFHGGVPGTWGEADREKRNRAQPASSQSPILIGHQQSLELSKTLCSSLTIWESSLKSQLLPFFFSF